MNTDRSRRRFVLQAGATLLLPVAVGQSAPALKIDLSGLPNFCSHEHWGSISSIGWSPDGFRADMEQGATPNVRTGLLDLLVDPYWRGWAEGGGANLEELASPAGLKFVDFARKSPWEAYDKLRPVLRRHAFTGVIECLRRGVLQLYGADLLHLDRAGFGSLDDRIALRYAGLFDWYREAMRRAHFSDLIRPVQPEFYARRQSEQTAAQETSFTRTVLRVDPFLDLWKQDSPRRKILAGIAGVEPGDARSWRQFLAAVFDLAASKSAVGIKQLQAYSRSLDFPPVEDTQVRFSGDLTVAEERVFQNWVMNECCKLAHERGWAHQVHVGTNNLAESSPLPLIPLAQRYPRMKLVMIHCWPFLSEAGWLAKNLPNAYIDTCWQPVLSPRFFREAIAKWWNYVPTHKITCGHDCTSVEMAAGSSLFTREILAEVLQEQSRESGATEMELRDAAAGLLHHNAVALYGPPKVAQQG